jgi:hypothetical protein
MGSFEWDRLPISPAAEVLRIGQRCNMVIHKVDQACGYIEDGELMVFDAPVCLLASYEEFREREMAAPSQVYFADYQDGKWHPADSTAFLLTEHIPTVMEAGVVCFRSSEAAAAARSHPEERLTDWIGYRTVRGNPIDIARVLSLLEVGGPHFF